MRWFATWAPGCVWCLAAALGGCSGKPAPLGSTPATDQVLNVFNWGDFIDPSVLRDFEQETGIKVHYDVYDSNEMLEARMLAGHTSYDVVVPGGSFFEKGIKAGVYRHLEREKLPNLKNLDAGAVAATAAYDPGNQFGVDYMWLVTVGLGFDAAQVDKRAPDAPTQSWRLLFDPKVAARLQPCGISLLDSPDDVVSAALSYLGKDPNSESLDDLAMAERLLMGIRPYIRYFDSSRYIEDLANGEICLALGWSGDIAQARQRAREAGKTRTIVYAIPQEGSVSIVDVLAIPADAPHPGAAYAFIDYLLRPAVAARNSRAVFYASGVAGAMDLLDEASRNDAIVYPPPAARARLRPMRARSQEFTRSLMRMWTRFKTGR